MANAPHINGSRNRSPFCVAVDWGTSSFRLWVMDADGQSLSESRGDEGMAVAAAQGFPDVLTAHLAAANAPADTPIVISGMAGARQGWREAAYVRTPAQLASIPAQAISVDFGGRDVRILPGVAQSTPGAEDVMRGEETQLLGAASSFGDGLVCIPGTHSKWATLNHGHIESFTTYMTGELYALLGAQSILSHGVAMDAEIPPGNTDFLAAIGEMQTKGAALTEKLFSIRARGLLGAGDAASGAARLSGLLIGAEISAATNGGAVKHATLLAAGATSRLYAAALTATGVDVTTLDAEAAARKGLHRAACILWGETT